VRPWTETTPVGEGLAKKKGIHTLDRRVFRVVEQMLE
jgi:hypothetical protein